MNRPVDYDKMFGKPSDAKPTNPELDAELKKEKEWQERWKKDMAERNRHSEAVENFRNGPKHHEGYFERSEGFADIYYPDGPPPRGLFSRRSRERYYDYVTTDLFLEYIDGFLVAALLGILVWALFPFVIPVTIAAGLGFILGVNLKLRVRDRMPAGIAFKRALPCYIILPILVAVIIVVFK